MKLLLCSPIARYLQRERHHSIAVRIKDAKKTIRGTARRRRFCLGGFATAGNGQRERYSCCDEGEQTHGQIYDSKRSIEQEESTRQGTGLGASDCLKAGLQIQRRRKRTPDVFCTAPLKPGRSLWCAAPGPGRVRQRNNQRRQRQRRSPEFRRAFWSPKGQAKR